MRKRDILSMYASGLCELLFAALGFATIGLLCFQTIAHLTDSTLDADALLLFLWQTVVLMALWPGQTFWTIRRKSPGGIEHSIIGAPSDDDLRMMNRQAAQRILQHPRD